MMRRGWWRARPLLICYAPLGDPECPENLLRIYAGNGVDIIEIGVPTADPYLDGRTVANSMRRVLVAGDPIARLKKQIVAQANSAATSCRLVLMGYNDMPFRSFTDLAQHKLIHGLIMADAGLHGDPDELNEWLQTTGLERIGFVDSALSPNLIDSARQAGGYVMLQAHNGPTGVRDGFDESNAEKIRALRRASVDLPIVLGFGIGSPQQAATAIALGADGVVVGSACIDAAREGAGSLSQLVSALRRAIDDASAGVG